MTDSPQLEDDVRANERSLKRLSRAIELSRGRFSLILVRCNYTGLQLEMQQRLRELCSVDIESLILQGSATTLYTALKTKLGDAQPAVVMVSGFESVIALDNLLVATNQVRDDFYKSFAFPLVLWLSDEVLKKLMRLAPDFNSWAGVPIQFVLSTNALIDLFRRETDALFLKAMEVGAGRFPRSSALYSEIEASPHAQLKMALKELRDRRGSGLDPALEANLQFVLGLDAYTNGHMEEARQCYENSLSFWQNSEKHSAAENSHRISPSSDVANHQTESSLPSVDRQGCLLFYLGLWWRRYAVLHRADYFFACREARYYYQKCIEVLQRGHRPALVAKFINALGEVLRQLGSTDNLWDELETVAKTAVDLHQLYFDPIRLAYSYGFLAEVALARAEAALKRSLLSEVIQQSNQAKQYAELALTTNEHPPDSTPEAQRQYAELSWARQHYRSLYLLLLAQSQRRLGSVQQSVETLEIAKEQCNHAYDPSLYIRILDTLRELYYEQAAYQKAFDTKREQRSIEQQYSLRAFIGAGHLEPERQVINPGLMPMESAEVAAAAENLQSALPPQAMTVAQEIAASGRQRDVENLIKRLSEPRHNLTIIHGQSGVGKSSIITAGLIPALKQQPIGDRRVLPVILKTYEDWVRRLGTRFNAALLKRGIREKASDLREALQPEVLIEQLRRNADRHSLLTVLIFDQFEEFFFAYPNPLERRSFFKFLHDCLNLPYVKVVLSLREDYLHHLLECSRLDPDYITEDILGRDKRYPLGNFSINEARVIIERLTQRSQFHMDADLIEQLVMDLAADFGEVRPIELQVVGAQLQDDYITTLHDYRALGEKPKEQLVDRFLKQVIRDCGPENEQAAKLVLYLLTDEKGTRPLKTLSDLRANLETWMVSDIAGDLKQLELVLSILVKSGLVLLLPEIPDERYQLVHDYLAALIQHTLKAEVDQYRASRADEQQRQHIQDQLDQARKRLRRRSVILAGVAISGLSAIGLAGVAYDQMNRAANAEVEATIALSSQLLRANEQLQALTSSVKAGVQLEKQLRRPFLLNLALSETRTTGNLLEAVYSIQERDRLIGHRAWVSSVSFRQADQLIASASADNTMILWDESGTLRRRLEGHTSRVNSIAFSPDGQRLASASDDRTLKIWNAQGEVLATLAGHRFFVTSVSFSPDGRVLASGSDDKTVKLWNSQSGQLVKTLEGDQGHRDRVKAVSFNANGVLATASWDGTVKLWNQNGQWLRQLGQVGDARVTSVSFSPDGKTLVSGSWDNTIKLWSTEGQLLHTFRGHTDRVISVGFRPDGQAIVSASNDGTVKLWRLDGIELKTLRVPDVISVSFAPWDSKILASTGADNLVRLWNLDGILPTTLRHDTPVASVSFSADGQWIVSASRSFEQDLSLANLRASVSNPQKVEGQLKRWSVDGREWQVFPAVGNFSRVEFSPNSQWIASAETAISGNTNAPRVTSRVKLWTLDGRSLKTLNTTSEVVDLSFSPDNQTIAIAENLTVPVPPGSKANGSVPRMRGQVTLWNHARGGTKTLFTDPDRITSLQFSPDGKTLVSAGDDTTVKVLTLDGDTLITWKGHNKPVKSISVSPDGRMVASGSADNTVKLWSMNGQQPKTLIGHTSSVTSVSFSQDGKLLLSGSDRGTLKVWSVADSSSLATLQKNETQVNSVSFSPDGQTIASASNDNTVSLWQFDLNTLLNRGCTWLSNYLKTNQNSQDDALCSQRK